LARFLLVSGYFTTWHDICMAAANPYTWHDTCNASVIFPISIISPFLLHAHSIVGVWCSFLF